MDNNIEQKIMEYFLKTGKKLTKDEMRKKIGISGETELAFFDASLQSLREKGELYLDKKDFYHVFDEQLVISQGELYISSRGDGYVKIISKKDGKKINYMIRNNDLNGGLPNDTVIIRPEEKKYRGHQFAKVEQIIKRDDFKEVYEYIGDGLLKLRGINQEVYLQLHNGDARNLVKGTLVLAEAGKEPRTSEEGKIIFDGLITNIAGHVDDPKSDIKAVALQFGFDEKFSKKIEQIASSLPTEVSPLEIEGITDSRNEKIFTMDGADTKDIDDAISISKDGDNYILKVDIANLSHYVKEHKELVESAINRGNSAYLADSVCPMFPHSISNGICSLNENKDRLTWTTEATIDKNGKIIDSSIYRSVINSKKQMRYNDVNTLYKTGIAPEGYEEYVDDLNIMRKLSSILTAERKSRGGLVLADREIKIYTDKDGNTVGIERRYHGIAEQIIENFMIVSNRIMTEHLGYIGYPFIFRVHEAPDADKLLKTLKILRNQELIPEGIIDNLIIKSEQIIETGKGEINSSDLAPVLNSIKDSNCFEAVSNVILRSLKKAKYSSTNMHHFGLSEEDYCHSTAPIRRASDLLIQMNMDYYTELNQCTDENRMIEIENNINKIHKKLNEICEHISKREVDANEAERKIEEIKQIQYVAENIEHFNGPIPAQILHINKMGARIIVDDLVKADIDTSDLEEQGYSYKHDSRTFVAKDKTCLKFGTGIWVSEVNPSPENKRITYKSVSLEKEKLESSKPDEKPLIKTHKLH